MNEKLISWLKANKFNVNESKLWGGVKLALLFLFSHHARALICIYITSHSHNKIKSLIFQKILRSHYHVECCCKKIGFRLMIPHPKNIILWAQEIGDDVLINQNVTIGGNLRKEKQREWGVQTIPIIKDRVMILTNAVVGGPIVVENDVIIGANCTCTQDVPANSMVYSRQYLSEKKIKVSGRKYQTI